MKKMFASILLIVFVSASLFASAELDLGGTAQYQVRAEEIPFKEPAKIFNSGQFLFGPEVRLKIAILELGASMYYTPGPKENPFYKHQLAGVITAGISFDLGSVLRLGLGVGPRLIVRWDKDGNIIVRDGNGKRIENVEGLSVLGDSTIAYKASADLLLGDLLLGLNYTVDSNMTFNNPSLSGVMPEFKDGKVGVTAMFRIGG